MIAALAASNEFSHQSFVSFPEEPLAIKSTPDATKLDGIFMTTDEATAPLFENSTVSDDVV